MNALLLILVFGTSFFLSLYIVPVLIRVAILKRLFDEPGERKVHKRVVPTIGGVIIYAGTIFSFTFWFDHSNISDLGDLETAISEFKYIVAMSLFLFFIGIKDDIIGTAPIKKLIANIIVGLVLVLMAGVRITGLHGILGVEDIPLWASVFLSLFTYIVVVNALNLIDGVDGLAAGVGFIASCAMGTFFLFARDYTLSSLAFALAGSLGGFLIFNFNPAKIFMGDSGSLTIGLILCFLGIKLIEYPSADLDYSLVHLSKPVLVIAALIYPLSDTLRVFLIRSLKGVSPFSADRNHLHHKLLDCGFGHKGTVITIYIFTVCCIAISLLSIPFGTTIGLGILILFSAICIGILQLVYRSKNPKQPDALESIDESII